MKPQPAKPAKPIIGDNVSRIVKILLARDEMRQQDLADALDYDSATVTRKLKGEREWRLTDIVRLSDFFEVPARTFFDDPDSLIIIRCLRGALVA